MNPADLLVLLAFWALLGATAADPARRRGLVAKPSEDWLLDGAGLLVQGVGIPLLQAGLAYGVLAALAPERAGTLGLPAPAGFLLAFVGVDYLFYWNHRLLHSQRLWPAHRVHHTMTARDVLGTSRNTLWSSLLICYLWVHGAMLFWLADPRGYLAGMALTAALDLWRHSELDPRPDSWLEAALAPWLVLPRDHAWHHATGEGRCNYGANLKLWDRLHGTACPEVGPPTGLGDPFETSLLRRLFWPFESRPDLR